MFENHHQYKWCSNLLSGDNLLSAFNLYYFINKPKCTNINVAVTFCIVNHLIQLLVFARETIGGLAFKWNIIVTFFSLSFVLTYLPTYLLNYLSNYLSTYLTTYLLNYLSTYLTIYLHTYPPTSRFPAYFIVCFVQRICRIVL